MDKYNPEGQLVIEQAFLKVPYEQVRKSYRQSQKYLEKDLGFVNHTVADLVKQAKRNMTDGPASHQVLENVLSRLNTLKRKLSETKADETACIQRSKLRAAHLNQLFNITSYDDPAYAKWSETRLNRMLADYMLRKGYYDSAERLASEQHIESFVDVDFFREALAIEDSLSQKSCTKCLQWCSDNKVALRKIKSSLEFDLHLQEFIEQARAGQARNAIQYAKKYLVAWSETHAREIEQAMGLMAFRADTHCYPYKKLYDPERWQELICHFREDNFALHSLTEPSPLLLTLQTGLSALKSTHCYHDEDRNINCPVCQKDTLGRLARALPYSHQVNSNLVCRVTGQLMNEDNPPMKLPNGRVYSLQALQQMALENNGEVRCPVTGQTFDFTDAKKLFIS
ncbi:GID complex subunit containing RING finger motif [Tieghemiomyces parasiticus]|uniref:GID complex subunit containing RING finger motif n=1 Tax=Tieghemiomyces parasiticus TaxID=78921 RepID=A0A9W7ZHV5_9FUNG|nr:GID complex subunit containing RING finger motif [Tieghemiomyces parasiticus]